METILGAIGVLLGAFKPFLAGIVIAYILALPCNELNNFFVNKLKFGRKSANIASVIIIEVVTIIVITTFCIIILPQCYDSIVKILHNLPGYIDKLHTEINNFLSNNQTLQTFGLYSLDFDENVKEYITSSFSSNLSGLTSGLYGSLSRLWVGILDTLIAYISSIFVLFNRDRCVNGLNMLVTVLAKHRGETIIGALEEGNANFRKFVVGKFIDSCIVGVICFIVLSFLGVPYVVFNSTFIGITNMIPIFGPFIGAVPCTLILLIDTPGKAIEFIAVILIIQQIDGNILGPKLIGGKVGISAYWILFSVVVFGRLFGIFGMFFGVPFFTTVYKLIKRRVIDLYNKKDNLVDDEID